MTRCLICCLLLAWSCTVTAHQELEAHIRQLSLDIETEPANPDLYLKRGNLYRRHGDWKLSAADFSTARRLAPELVEVDWYEGHMHLDAGEFQQADDLLSRYLEENPESPVALQQRAEARMALERPLEAAADYAQAAKSGTVAGPQLYSDWALALIAGGESHFAQASRVVADGLVSIPGEINLLGLATDLALAMGDGLRAVEILDGLNPGLAELTRWQFRRGLAVCLNGDAEAAKARFLMLLEMLDAGKSRRNHNWEAPRQDLPKLARDPSPARCRATAIEQLEALHNTPPKEV